jgi:hypothetical protein
MGLDAAAVAPRLSVIVTVGVQVPVPYECVVTGPDWAGPTAPSPKSNWYDTMVPSESLDPDAFRVTVSGALPPVGAAARDAIGLEFAVTVAEAVLVPPLWSVTVTTADHVPAA